MLDRLALALVKPTLDRLAVVVRRQGLSADQVSVTGFAFGILAAIMIVAGASQAALLPLAVNRLLDGLDGAVARLATPTHRGAFLDITLDFIFYAGIPLAFAICDPARNALAAAVLLAAFIGTGVSFLAYAIIAEQRGEKSADYPSKAFYYLGGLTEGTETIACFALMCLWPAHFAIFAYVYAGMCAITTATRLAAGWSRFGTG